ncbi:MAG: peptidoglycan-binding protein, partial [Pseudomonadota bacterium]
MFRTLFALLLIWLALPSFAQRAPQGLFWVQIRAVPNATRAVNVATQLDQTFENIVGFEVGGGWYALALGPYDQATAQSELAALLGRRLVPGDSFVANGTSYRNQYWPSDLTLPVPNIAYVPATDRQTTIVAAPNRTPDTDTGTVVLDPIAPAPEPTPAPALTPEETVSQARASEAALSREDKRTLQRALTWAGVYASAIDGLYGRGTRAAMRRWQDQQNLDPTGVLTTRQRAALLADYNAVFDGLGLTQQTITQAGISIEVPVDVVSQPQTDAPFVRYAATGQDDISLVLISQPGGRDRMRALYEVMQTLKILPDDGPRSISSRGFQIEGQNDTRHSEAFVRLQGGQIKGAILSWPAGDDTRRQRVRDRIFASFRTQPGVLPDATFLDTGTPPADNIAGLEVRKPIFARTGTMLDARGHILTASADLDSCTRIDTIEDQTLTKVASQDGLAIYRAAGRVAPITAPPFQETALRLRQDIVLGGYSYGGLLGGPTITQGTLEDTKDLQGNAAIARLSVNALDGDIGGPILDKGGAIIGVLLPQPQ